MNGPLLSIQGALVAALFLVLSACASTQSPNTMPGRAFSDCATCPTLVVLPAGQFMMGSPETESNRDADEGPAVKVTIAKPFAIGQTEVTRGQFNAFVRATGYKTPTQCMIWKDDKLQMVAGYSWQGPSIPQTDDHPAVCISWHDAAAYADWLTRTTGHRYRLPSNAEWEYAARGGRTEAYSFPGDEDDACAYGNIADATAKKAVATWRVAKCDDGVGLGTATVKSYKPNGYGVYDTVGNVWEWIADCYHATYDGTPTDGTPWGRADECNIAFDRGGGFSNLFPGHLRAANRSRAPSPDNPVYSLGFRIARDLN